MSPDEVDAAWRAYKETGDPAARELLILHYRPLIDIAVRRYAPESAPTLVDRGDLAGFGVFGLMDAIERFDLSLGFKFETYAMSRIKGAIVDEVRDFDEVPRSVRAKAETIRQAWARFEHKHGRAPVERELADELDWTAQQLHVARSQVAHAVTASLDEPPAHAVAEFGDEALPHQYAANEQQSDPASNYEIEELRSRVLAALGKLPDREQVLMLLYYGEGLTGAEIGTILGVTESRVVQLHTAAMLSLSSALR